MALHSLFPTFVYQKRLVDSRVSRPLIADLKADAASIVQVDTVGLEWSKKNYRNGYTSYGSWDSLHEHFPAFQDLARHLNPHIKAYTKRQHWDLGGGGLELVSMWINIMPPGTVHSLHLHPLSVVSGTFYVQTPAGTSPIKFEDPRLDRYMGQPPRHHSAPETEKAFYTVTPKAGDVVLFDSWLRHEVPQTPIARTAVARSGRRSKAPTGSKSNQRSARLTEFDLVAARISVSFNFDWR